MNWLTQNRRLIYRSTLVDSRDSSGLPPIWYGNPPEFKFYLGKLNNKNYPQMV